MERIDLFNKIVYRLYRYSEDYITSVNPQSGSTAIFDKKRKNKNYNTKLQEMIKIKIRNNNIKQWSLMRRLIQSSHQIHHPETNRSKASLKLLEPTVRPAPRAQTAASGTIKLLPQDVFAKIGSLFCLNTSINRSKLYPERTKFL